MKTMLKNLSSIILAALLILTMVITAFASPNSGIPIGGYYEQFDFVSAEMETYLEKEVPMWDYKDYFYTADDGTIWRWYCDQNWIVSTEDPNWYYQIMEDGTLYVIDGSDHYAERVNLIIPSTLDGKTVTRVRRAGNSTTQSITIPDTVTKIDYHSFYNMESLKYLIIPDTVKSIEVRAFKCNDKIDIYYTGTPEQWNEIVVWNQGNTAEPEYWAVTGFDWLKKPYKDLDWPSPVNEIYYNVNPDNIEIKETPDDNSNISKEPSFFENLISDMADFIATITEFFKNISAFFGSLF